MGDDIIKEHFGNTHVRRISSVCDLCVEYEDGDDPCNAQMPGSHVRCSRPHGHDGPHAACGNLHTQHPAFAWAEAPNG